MRLRSHQFFVSFENKVLVFARNKKPSQDKHLIILLVLYCMCSKARENKCSALQFTLERKGSLKNYVYESACNKFSLDELSVMW